MLRWGPVWLDSLLMTTGFVDCVTGLYHAWRFGHRSFAFNSSKVRSKRTSFGAVKTFSALCTIRLKPCYVFLAERQCFFCNMLHFFLAIRAIAKLYALAHTFYNVHVPCDCCETWCETRTAFSSLYSKFRQVFMA